MERPYHEIATENELIDLCSKPRCDRLGSIPGCNRIVRISTEAVIKFGIDIQEEEASNLVTARSILHPHIVRIPRMFRYFSREDVGYLVMEFIDGATPEPSEYTAIVPTIAKVLDQLHQHHGEAPGPLQGGVSRGIMWDSDEPRFGSLDDMNQWFKRRKTDPKLDVTFTTSD